MQEKRLPKIPSQANLAQSPDQFPYSENVQRLLSPEHVPNLEKSAEAQGRAIIDGFIGTLFAHGGAQSTSAEVGHQDPKRIVDVVSSVFHRPGNPSDISNSIGIRYYKEKRS